MMDMMALPLKRKTTTPVRRHKHRRTQDDSAADTADGAAASVAPGSSAVVRGYMCMVENSDVPNTFHVHGCAKKDGVWVMNEWRVFSDETGDGMADGVLQYMSGFFIYTSPRAHLSDDTSTEMVLMRAEAMHWGVRGDLYEQLPAQQIRIVGREDGTPYLSVPNANPPAPTTDLLCRAEYEFSALTQEEINAWLKNLLPTQNTRCKAIASANGCTRALEALFANDKRVPVEAVYRGVLHNQEAVVRFLLDKMGSVVEVKQGVPTGIIEDAARMGHLTILQLLEERGVQPTTECLQQAATYGHQQIVHHLLDGKGASEFGKVLQAAALKSGEDVATLLQRTVQTAARCGHLDLLKYFMEDKGISATQFALSDAAYSGCDQVVQYLVNRGMPVTDKVIEHTVTGGSVAVMQFLMDHCGVKPTDEHALTAASHGCKELVEFLIEKNGIRATEDLLRTAIMYRHTDTTRYLIESCGVVLRPEDVAAAVVRAILRDINYQSYALVRYVVTKRNIVSVQDIISAASDENADSKYTIEYVMERLFGDS